MIIYVDFVYTERIYRKKEVANEDIEYETEYPNRFLGRKKKKKKSFAVWSAMQNTTEDLEM